MRPQGCQLRRQSGHNTGTQEASASEYQQSAKRNAQIACRDLETAAIADCIYDEISSARQQEQGEQDLAAQQWMAWWAGFLTVITAATTLISWIALRYLRDTFVKTAEMAEGANEATKAMLDANEIAREIGQAQVRAYIKCSKVTCKPMGQNHTDDLFSVVIETKNLGQSPALNMQVIVGIEIFEFPDKRAGAPLQINAPHDSIMAPQGDATALLSFGYAKGAADAVRASKAYIRITVAYVYDDVFGERTELVTCHHTEGKLLDDGITAAHIVTFKPEYRSDEGKKE